MNRLKELRESRNYTKEYLANLAGIPRVTVSYLESGKRPMRIQHAEVLAPIFGVSVDYIMGTDAIYYAGAFRESIQNVLDSIFDSSIEAVMNGTLDDLSRLLQVSVDRIINSDFTASELELLNKYMDSIIAERGKK